MTDLFGTPILPGLETASELVTPEEERALIVAIDAAGLSPFRFQGWAGKRLKVFYGWTYDFEAGRLSEGPPLPSWLLPYRDRVARLARLPSDDLVQVLLIRYDPGAGIGWHKDRPAFEHIIGISLGAPAVMRFRRRRSDSRVERRRQPLRRGSQRLR